MGVSILKVALTGGIATGKSYCLARFARKGVTVIDADVLAHALVRQGEAAWTAVRDRFGEGVLQANGEIDRRQLAAVVFADEGARRDLEAIIHPAVYTAIREWYQALPASVSMAMADIPLLYETAREREFDRVIATWAPQHVQLARMMERDGLSEDDARNRLAAQLPAGEKARRADYVIRTDQSFAETDRQIDDVLRSLEEIGGRG